MKIPYTPLSTRLSGSARETELRLRNIFSGPKKRPPALFLALVFSVCIFCGNLVSCRNTEAEAQPSAEVWVDYWMIPWNVPWEDSAEIEPPEYPGVTFRWTPGSVSAVKDGETVELFSGMPIWNVFLCDMSGDGLRELCATVNYGSGIVDSHVVVYDYAAGVAYTLWDRGIEDYTLSLEDGRLRVTRAEYLGPALSTGGLALTGDGTLKMTDEVPVTDALSRPYGPESDDPLTEGYSPIAVPSFLTEDQQDLYRRARSLYEAMFGGETMFIDYLYKDQPDDTPYDTIEIDGYTYTLAKGRYRQWDDFDAAVHSVFTDSFWGGHNNFGFENGKPIPIYRDIDGRLGIIDLSRGSGYFYNENFPDEFRLDARTDNTINFTLIGHYSQSWPEEGEIFEERDKRRAEEYEYTLEFPIKMILTDYGWRFDEFYSPISDEE